MGHLLHGAAGAAFRMRTDKKGDAQWRRPFRPVRQLLDCQFLGRRGRLFRQGQFQHAIAVPGLGLGVVHFVRQREAARHLAVVTLGTQHLLALFLFLFHFRFGADRDLVAFDADVDVFLLHPRDISVHRIGVVVLLQVHLDLHLRLAFEGDRAHEEALEQVVEVAERIDAGEIEGIVTGEVGHDFFS